MEDIIKAIAGKFSWDKGTYWLITEARSCCPYDCTDGFSIIVFAAHAKAEMAKRGFAMRTGKAGVYICTYGPGSGEGVMTISSHHTCNHTDPISVAEAELRCIADALQSNSPDR